MIKILQKLVILWEKSKFLTLMEMETDYIKRINDYIIVRDIDDLRKRLGELRASKDAKSSEIQREIIDLEAEINETEKFRQMIETSHEKSEDLKKQISLYWSNIWK